MKFAKFLSLAAVLAGLAACSAPEMATRKTPAPVLIEDTGTGTRSMKLALAAQYDVAAIEIIVPRTLVVSEKNSYLPKGDIVWRGDPVGDRYAQVEAIFQTAFAQGTASMTKGPRVKVVAEVTMFHCLSEKARFTIGGIHNMQFNLSVIDLDTGAVLQGPRLVNAEIKAAGGQAALDEEAAGRTQKVVVTEHLAHVIRRELSTPVALAPGKELVSRNTGTVMIVANKG